MFSAKSSLRSRRPFAKTLKLVVWAFSLNFLHDSTLFVIDIHQNVPISLILTPFDHFQIRLTFAVTPNLILEPCLILIFIFILISIRAQIHCIKIKAVLKAHRSVSTWLWRAGLTVEMLEFFVQWKPEHGFCSDMVGILTFHVSF